MSPFFRLISNLCFAVVVRSFFFSCCFIFDFSPLRSSFAEIPRISQSCNMIEESGILFPVSHLDTARSVMFSFSASCACVSPFSLRHLEINFPISV